MSNSLELTGTLYHKSETQHVTPSFAKRDFVLFQDGQYPQHIQFQLTQGNCDRIENINIGEEITVKFNVRGRQLPDKNNPTKYRYFNQLDAWHIIKGSPEMPTPETYTNQPSIKPADDLPF